MKTLTPQQYQSIPTEEQKQYTRFSGSDKVEYVLMPKHPVKSTLTPTEYADLPEVDKGLYVIDWHVDQFGDANKMYSLKPPAMKSEITEVEYKALSPEDKERYQDVLQFFVDKWEDCKHDLITYALSGLSVRKIYRLKQPIEGLDLNKLENQVDDFMANTTGEDYKKMFDEMDKEIAPDTVEQAAYAEAYCIGKPDNTVLAIRNAFIAGANWQSTNPDNISKAKVLEILEAEINGFTESELLYNTTAMDRVKVITGVIEKIKAL